jgi:hypothetical protein
MGTLIFLGVFWGIPMYLVDTRARHNYHSPRRRLFIAVLMIWWGLIIPAVIAVAIAGPKPARRSRRSYGSYPAPDRDTPRVEDYDDRAARDNAKRYRDHQQAQAKRLREEAEARNAQQREAEKRTAEREALTLKARQERQERAARERTERQQRESRERTERQDRADSARQQQNDLFMTWDERGEEELAE